MRKQPVEKKYLDKLFLLITAVLVLIAVVGLFGLLDHYHFSAGWSFFVYLNIFYVVLVTYFCLPILKRAVNKKTGCMLLAALEISVITAVFALCYYGIVPLPEKGLLIFTIFLTVPGVITVVLFDQLLKHFNLSKKRI